MRTLYSPRPIQPYPFQPDLIWCDGTFKSFAPFKVQSGRHFYLRFSSSSSLSKHEGDGKFLPSPNFYTFKDPWYSIPRNRFLITCRFSLKPWSKITPQQCPLNVILYPSSSRALLSLQYGRR